MQLQRILCPVDFSDSASRAVELAGDLATKLGAKVDLLHAYQLPAYALPDGAFVASPDFAVRVQDESQQHLHTLAESLRARGVAVETHVVEGGAGAEIAR